MEESIQLTIKEVDQKEMLQFSAVYMDLYQIIVLTFTLNVLKFMTIQFDQIAFHNKLSVKSKNG